MNVAAVMPTTTLSVEIPSLLDANVEGVILNFFVRDPSLVSSWLWSKAEPKKASATNGTRPLGVEIVPSTEEISLKSLVDDLHAAGFVLTDGFGQLNPPTDKFSKGGSARFFFHREGDLRFQNTAGQKAHVQTHIAPALESLVSGAFWKVQGWRNTLDAEEGRYGFGFKLDTRVPLVDPAGNVITRRKKDAEGRKIGDPLPLEPAGHLRVINNCVTLT